MFDYVKPSGEVFHGSMRWRNNLLQKKNRLNCSSEYIYVIGSHQIFAVLSISLHLVLRTHKFTQIRPYALPLI